MDSIIFGQLLTEAVRVIAAREGKAIATVHDELGYALGKAGGSSIEYWRKGHIPATTGDVLALVEELTRRGGLTPESHNRLLRSARMEEASSKGSINWPPGTDLATPFVVGPPIFDPRQFYGRGRDLRRLFGLWQSSPLQHAAVIGPRRSGKTSLLRQLAALSQAAAEQLRVDQFAFRRSVDQVQAWVWVDFQDSRMLRRERVLASVLGQLGLPIPQPCDLERFLDVVSDRLKGPVVWLFDEIEAALAAPELDEAFWNSLRALISHGANGRIGCAVAAHTEPMQLAQQQGKPSPFFNLFRVHPLGPWDESEARAFLATSPRPFAEAEIDWIIAASGRWPYLVQLLADLHLAALQDGARDSRWRTAAAAQLNRHPYLLNAT